MNRNLWASFKLFGTCLGAVLCCALISEANAFSFQTDGSRINTVKKLVLPDYSRTQRLGSAVEGYYDCIEGTQQWEAFESEEDKQIVEYNCALKEHTTYFSGMGPEIELILNMQIAGAVAGQSLLGTLDDNQKQILSQINAKGIVTFDKVELCLQFAQDLTDSDNYLLDYIGLDLFYPDGTEGTFPLYHSALQSVYDDGNMFDTEEGEELVSDLIKARIGALEQASAAE